MARYTPLPTSSNSKWRLWLYHTIFDVDTKESKLFDVLLLWAIVISVVAVMLESVPHIAEEYGLILNICEWAFTGVFTLEYLARILAVRRPLRYMTSFFGIVDLLSILPAYLGLFVTATESLIVIRILRFLRIFRVLKLVAFMRETIVLKNAIRDSRKKITVFLVGISIAVVILGTVMYLIEGAEAGFTSIPRSIYWAIVTITTVGYGDIAPQTAVGQTLASIIMIMGYAVIAVPTGIVTAEMAAGKTSWTRKNRSCDSCGEGGHDEDAQFCKFCGHDI